MNQPAEPRRRRHRLVALLLLAATGGCAAFEAPVARTVDGVTTEGRFIEPDAYALYAVAALHEARGQAREALALYRRALLIDGRGPELRTRIGAVSCKLGQKEAADRAFAAALRSASDYGPLWYELAQCLRSRADLPGAERAALEALRLDPERHETSLLAADLAELRGDRARAWRIRDALLTHAPESLVAWRGVLAAARRGRDQARAARAERALNELTGRSAAAPPAHGVAHALAALDRGDVPAAQQAAQQLLGADPANGDALIIALAVADLAQDQEGFEQLLENAKQPLSAASPEVLRLLQVLLSRRVNADAGDLVRPQP